MKTEWDYTDLADAYLQRPEYANDVLTTMFQIADLKKGDHVCDIGAGVAHLTLPLAHQGFVVDAVEPNDAMRTNGIARTKDLPNVHWSEGTGEATGRPTANYDFVTFGSSFNVCDRNLALKETYRLLKPQKWFACLWNHRDLNDPIQATIEDIIKQNIPTYTYGTRREDQAEIILASKLFVDVKPITGQVKHLCTIDTVIEAWRSHATLHRQAKDKFPLIIEAISKYLHNLNQDAITIPYTTHAWMARRYD